MSDDPPTSGPRPPRRGRPGIRHCVICKRPVVGDGHKHVNGFDFHKNCWATARAKTAGTHYHKDDR